MKKVSTFRNILLILLGTLLVSACGVAEAQPVQALAGATSTVEANTPVPLPAEGIASLSPTPSRMELAVQNSSLEVRVLAIETPYIVDLNMAANLSNELVFTPGAGNIFLTLGVKVSNLTDSDISLKWADVYLVNKYQDKWYPVWGAYEKSNVIIDPLTIKIVEFDQVSPDYDPDAHLYLGDNGYLRVIFRVPKDNLYYFFGITDVPLIEINWRYY